MKRIALSFCILVPLLSFAQGTASEHAIDSLRKCPVKQKDSAYVNRLADLCFQFKALNLYDSVAIYAQQELDLSQQLGYKRGVANATNSFAMNSRAKGKYPEAKAFNEEALKLRQTIYDSTGSIDDLRNLSSSFNNLGLVNYNMGAYIDAMKFCNKSLKLRQTVFASTKSPRDNNLIAQTMNNMGIIYFDLGNYPDALKSYLVALKIYMDNDDKPGITLLKMNVGNLYMRQKDLVNALKYEQEGLDEALVLGKKKDIAQAYSNLGNIYHAMQDTAQAMRNYEKAFQLRMSINDENGLAATYGHIANIRLDQLNYTAALQNYELALAIADKQMDKNSQALNLVNEGVLYYKMHEFKKAKYVSQRSLEISLASNMKENAMLAYENLTRSDSALGDDKAAFFDYVHFLQFADSLQNENNSREIVKAQMNFEFDNIAEQEQADRDKKNALTAAEQERKRVQLYLVGGVFAIILIFALFMLRSYRTKKKVNIAMRVQKEILEEKQKEILDSIHYAKRIQDSLLPTEKYIARNLKK